MCKDYGQNFEGIQKIEKINFDESCQSELDGIYCPIHEAFMIPSIIKKKCHCGKYFDDERAMPNRYSLIVSS